jgi:hypothetical protein
MAPKGSNKGPSGNNGSGGRIKFRFVDIEMENVNEATTEGLRALAAALSRGPQAPSVRSLQRTLQGSPATAVPVGTLEIEDEEPTELDEGFDPISQAAETAQTGVPPENNKVRKPRALREPQFLREVDLTKATTSLEDFIQLKGPTSTMDKYLVIAQWFKEFMDIPEVTVDHIFTAYDVLGWRAQMGYDASQPLRAQKSAHMMDAGSSRATYKINWNGSKAVAGMSATE